MKDELQNYLDRPKRYENIDGTGEMAMGVMMLSFALVCYLSRALLEGWGKNGLATFVEFILVVFIPIWTFQHWGVKAIKQRFTWPRTGYVACRCSGLRWWTVLIAGVALGAGFGYLMVLARRSHALSLERAVWMVVLLAAYAFFVLRWSREHTWKWLVLIFMALGLLGIALVVPGGAVESFPPAALFLGLAWLGSGLGTLYLYIHHTQLPAPEGA